MSAPLTADETRMMLASRDVPAHLIERHIARAFPGAEPGRSAVTHVELAVIALPLRFTLPWTSLISENRRFCASKSRIFMTREYKAARAKVREIALKAMKHPDFGYFQPFAEPLQLHARVYFPDERIHDAPTFAGATHNALKKIVFKDDVWIHRAIWERAGTDPDQPRAEITISRYLVGEGC